MHATLFVELEGRLDPGYAEMDSAKQQPCGANEMHGSPKI
jgi:hypothetical protein